MTTFPKAGGGRGGGGARPPAANNSLENRPAWGRGAPKVAGPGAAPRSGPGFTGAAPKSGHGGAAPKFGASGIPRAAGAPGLVSFFNPFVMRVSISDSFRTCASCLRAVSGDIQPF